MTGEEVKALREKLGITQQALASKVGVANQTLNRWERGWFKPCKFAVEKLKQIEAEHERG